MEPGQLFLQLLSLTLVLAQQALPWPEPAPLGRQCPGLPYLVRQTHLGDRPLTKCRTQFSALERKEEREKQFSPRGLTAEVGEIATDM